MDIEQAEVIENKVLSGDYRVMHLQAPAVSAAAQPGQFIHLRVPRLGGRVLRRPFSIYGAENGVLSLLYKVVGEGTEALMDVAPGRPVDIIGPLGHGFPVEPSNTFPVLVAGGYGVAPLYFLATRLSRKGILFVGAATADDVLCVDRFKELGWKTAEATVDGSKGKQGLVTVLLDDWLASHATTEPEFFACGPDGMLKAVAARAADADCTAWLSLDKRMGCGVGACLACVQKLRNADGSESWARVCHDGPVFESRQIIW